MKPRSRPAPPLVLLVAALALAGCAAPRHALPPPAEDSALRERLAGMLAGRYPPQYRLVQRLALHAGGKQYDMMGYLVVSGPDSLRAVALGEMGGRIFDLALESGAPAILKKPEKMPPRPLADGVIADLRHLFLPPAGAALHLARQVDGGPALVGEVGPDRAVEYAFDPEGRHLTRSVESEAGRIRREVEYGAYRTIDGFDGEVPTRIAVTNRHWHYTLEVQALQLIPGPPPAAGTED